MALKWAAFEYHFYTVPHTIARLQHRDFFLCYIQQFDFIIISQKRQNFLCMRKHYNSKKKYFYWNLLYLKIVALYMGRTKRIKLC